MKEYKNQIISLSYKLEETDAKNKNFLEEIESKERRILEIEASKKELETRLEMNKEILELLSGLEKSKDEEFDIKGTVENYFKKPDGVRCLTNFIYVLNRKISDHQEEIDKLKNCQKKNYSGDKKSDNILNNVNGKELLSMIPDNGMNRNGKNMSLNTNNINKYDPEFNIPGRKRKINELYQGDDINNNMNSRIKLEKSNDKGCADRDRLASGELLSMNYSAAHNEQNHQNEMKVNINSNGLVNNNSFLKNKQVKPVEANGSPMNLVRSNEDKIKTSNINIANQPQLAEENQKLLQTNEKSLTSSNLAKKSFDIVNTKGNLSSLQNLNFANSMSGQNSIGNSNKKNFIENFTHGLTNANAISGKSVNISSNSFKTNQGMFKLKDSFLKK